METSFIKSLIRKYVNRSITEREEELLLAALRTDEETVKEAISMELADHQTLPDFQNRNYDSLIRKVMMVDAKDSNKPIQSAHRIHFLRTAWFKYAAAVLIIFGSVAYLWINNRNDRDLATTNGNKQLQADIAPGGNKAVLTLADGTQILLDSAANGSLAQQGSAQVVKLANGQIAYNLKGSAEGEVMMNTMATPKGGQYQLTLPDGSRVWLNAASSITYPAVFVGKQRNVKINGEAYFEVAKNTHKPFIVDINGKSTVEVLGTSFNINSYENEAGIKTTLVTGSVKVSNISTNAVAGSSDRQLNNSGTNDSRDQFAILKPGQQATIGNNAVIVVDPSADIEKALAWKNGWFNFNGATLYDVMRQLERWYDIKVQYEGNIPEVRFKGKMDKGVSLSGMLNFFSSLDFQIKTRVEGRTLIISGN